MSRRRLPVRRAAGLALSALLAAALGPGPADAADGAGAPASGKPLPVALVDAFNSLSGGPHKGFRANHAKGILVEGEFTPGAAARSLSKAAHFSRRVPVLVRFSDPTGVPTLPDADPNASPHGIAIRFTLPDGTSTDIVSISANGFPVATPEEFLQFLEAAARSGPDAPKPTPVETFLGGHPAALKFVSTPRPPPRSFATLAYFGVNAFKFTNATGAVRFARYQILPEAGEQSLDEAAAKSAAPNYLMDELPQRLARGPVKFRLLAQLAGTGDSTIDPTAVWPPDRPRIVLGTLTLSRVAKEQVAAQKAIMFNPLNLLDGIGPSADPVLLARPSAYGVSFSQRIP